MADSQTASKQFRNNSQIAQKTGFLSLIIVKIILSEGQNLTYKFILDVIYRPFELKILLQIGF